MISRVLELKNRLGLHARASAKFVELARTFTSDIKVVKNGEVADGKSILGLLVLAAAVGEKIEIIVNGKDEERAIEALTNLVNERFGENE